MKQPSKEHQVSREADIAVKQMIDRGYKPLNPAAVQKVEQNPHLEILDRLSRILTEFREADPTKAEVAYLLKLMEDFIPSQDEKPAFSIQVKNSEQIHLYFEESYSIYSEYARVLYPGSCLYKKLFRILFVKQEQNMVFEYQNTLWADLYNIWNVKKEDLLNIFSRENVENAILNNFSFLPILTTAPESFPSKTLKTVMRKIAPNAFQLTCSTTNRHISIMEIGSISVKDSVTKQLICDKLSQILVVDHRMGNIYLCYASFSLERIKLSSNYEAFVVDHLFSCNNLQHKRYLGDGRFETGVVVSRKLEEYFKNFPVISSKTSDIYSKIF